METTVTQRDKITYIKDFPRQLESLDPFAKGIWGKMNAQRLVEHLSDSMRVANGKEFQKIELPPERMEQVRAFFLSDKPFRENTTNHLIPDIPPPWRNATMQEAIAEFEKESDEFFRLFEGDPGHITINPFAGEFNFQQWVQLLHKHYLHHARQFGLSR